MNKFQQSFSLRKLSFLSFYFYYILTAYLLDLQFQLKVICDLCSNKMDYKEFLEQSAQTFVEKFYKGNESKTHMSYIAYGEFEGLIDELMEYRQVYATNLVEEFMEEYVDDFDWEEDGFCNLTHHDRILMKNFIFNVLSNSRVIDKINKTPVKPKRFGVTKPKLGRRMITE